MIAARCSSQKWHVWCSRTHGRLVCLPAVRGGYKRRIANTMHRWNSASQSSRAG